MKATRVDSVLSEIVSAVFGEILRLTGVSLRMTRRSEFCRVECSAQSVLENIYPSLFSRSKGNRDHNVHHSGVQRREPTNSKLNARPESNERQRENGDWARPAQPVARRLSTFPLVAHISIVPCGGTYPEPECKPVRYLVGACEPTIEGQVPYAVMVSSC